MSLVAVIGLVWLQLGMIGHGGRNHPLRKHMSWDDGSIMLAATNETMHVYAHDDVRARDGLTEGVYVYEQLVRLFGVVPVMEDTVHIYLVSPQEWDHLVKRLDVRHDGRSLQLRYDIVIKVGEQTTPSVQISHEWVHFMMYREGLTVPLFYEEGLATMFGWELALAWHLSQGTLLQRDDSLVGVHRIPLEILQEMDHYPVDSLDARLFYQQAERLTRAVAGFIGTESLVPWLRKMNKEDSDWRKALLSFSSMDQKKMTWIDKHMGAAENKAE